mmetsp:Transcript_31001/g.79020  ORF Transcript_31001/g.79020 Transcript_31001/m.79020 type:complete len:250 (+) Transcript_31001:700-1449(+)
MPGRAGTMPGRIVAGRTPPAAAILAAMTLCGDTTVPAFGVIVATGVMRGLLLGSSAGFVGARSGRLTPAATVCGVKPAVGRIVPETAGVAPGVAAPQASVDSHSAMYCSRALVASGPPTVVLKFWITYRRLCGVIFANIILVFVGSNFHLATKSAISRSSAMGPPAAAAPAAPTAPVGVMTPAGLMGTPTCPIGRTPPGIPMPIPGIAAKTLGRGGTTTSSNGVASGAPASLRCASTSWRSTFMTSSFH